MTFDKHIVKQAANGRWAEIYSALAPQLRLAQAHPGKHCPCPVHGGTDGFRLFSDYQEKGGGVCNTCGVKIDGFQMLMWLHDWSFPEVVDKVGTYLGLKPEPMPDRHVPCEPAKDGPREPETPKQDVFEGVVTFVGNIKIRCRNGASATTFAVKVRDEIGGVSTCMGVDLERAAKPIKVKKGDRVCITRLGTRDVTLPDGRTVKKTYWDIFRLEKELTSQNPVSYPAKMSSEDNRQIAIDHMWEAGRPLLSAEDTEATPVEQYLLNRDIDLLSLGAEVLDSIRYLPSAFYRNEQTGQTETYPAMLSAVRDIKGRLVNVHRTYLTPDGMKAPVATPKRLMAQPEGSTIVGAAVRFGMPTDVLCIAEGVETALSVTLGTGYPCWAAITAMGMPEVMIPKSVRTVLIFADKDRTETGAKAAEKLRARLAREGKLAVIVHIPDDIPDGAKGLDWNDVLQAKGVEAFPVQKLRD